MRHGRLLGTLLLTSLAGCADLAEFSDALRVDSRNRYLATQSWKSTGEAAPNEHFRDYRAGYLQGYYDVAAGGNGCPPVLPPRRYWASCYQSPLGHALIHAWFDGYNAGALAAQQDGVGFYRKLPSWCDPNGSQCCDEFPVGPARPKRVRSIGPRLTPIPPQATPVPPMPVVPLPIPKTKTAALDRSDLTAPPPMLGAILRSAETADAPDRHAAEPSVTLPPMPEETLAPVLGQPLRPSGAR